MNRYYPHPESPKIYLGEDVKDPEDRYMMQRRDVPIMWSPTWDSVREYQRFQELDKNEFIVID